MSEWQIAEAEQRGYLRGLSEAPELMRKCGGVESLYNAEVRKLAEQTSDSNRPHQEP